MVKYTKTILIILFLVVITFLFLSPYSKSKYPETTGGKVETPSPQEAKFGNDIARLKSAIPFTTNFFTITQFDYKTAKFQLIFHQKNDSSEKDFIEWLKNSEFNSIPKKRFMFIN